MFFIPVAKFFRSLRLKKIPPMPVTRFTNDPCLGEVRERSIEDGERQFQSPAKATMQVRSEGLLLLPCSGTDFPLTSSLVAMLHFARGVHFLPSRHPTAVCGHRMVFASRTTA